MPHQERVAVITGATGNLGSVMAHRLAEGGRRLALVSSNAEKLAALEKDLALPSEQLLTYLADLTQPHAAQSVLETVLGKFGKVDILLHFVGGWAGGMPVAEVQVDDVAQMLRQHLWTTLHLAQAFTPSLVANGWGRLVIVSSPNVSNTPVKMSPYTVAKSAQEALVLTLAEELKGTGVTANVVRVRAIDARRERTSQSAPSRTSPEEIAAAILYLCSDEAGMLNGARLPLYGSP